MKLGVHSATFVEDWSEDIRPYIKKCHEVGYKSIEVSLLGQDKIKARAIGLLASELNVEITCTTGLSVNEDITSFDNKIRLNGEKKLVEAIELTSLMNSSMLSGVVHCAWGISKEKGASKDIKFENSANSLTKITNALEVNNIKLGIEPLNRYETDFINTVDEGLHLCSLINHSNVGLLLDVYHMNIEEKNICSSIKRAKNKLFHFHVAENDRGIPGSGTLDFDSIFETLKEINYSGNVTLEMFIQANKQTSKDLFTWRDIEVDPYKAIKDSHLFLSKYY